MDTSLDHNIELQSRERFGRFLEGECSTLQEYLEARQSYYRSSLFLRSLIVGGLLLLAIFLVPMLHQHWLSSGEVDFGMLTAIEVLILVGAVFSIISPLHAFPGAVLGSAGYVRTGVIGKIRRLFYPRPFVSPLNERNYPSLKEMVSTEVFGKFGDFQFRPRGMNTKVNLMSPLLLPPHDEYRAEDNFTGAFEDALLDVAEAQLVSRYEGQEFNVFKGLFITIDISELGVKIRGLFRGRTALIPNEHTLLQSDKRFKQYELLPNGECESFGYTLYTTNQREAKAMVNQTILEGLVALDECFARFVQQRSHKKFHVLEMVKDFFSPKVGRIDHSKMEDAPYTINRRAQMSYYDDRVQISVPCSYNLFEAPTLFGMAIDVEELWLTYRMMEVVGDLTREVQARKDAFDNIVRN